MVTKQGLAANASAKSSTESAFENFGWHWQARVPRYSPQVRRDYEPGFLLKTAVLLSLRKGRGARKDDPMYIQYAGFNLQTDSRNYTFHVIDPPEKTREFTINVLGEAFRIPPFKIQDGPGICMVRLRQELARETQESRAEPSLYIGQSDISEYIEHNYPKPAKKWGIGSNS
jgi:hypothetical protein